MTFFCYCVGGFVWQCDDAFLGNKQEKDTEKYPEST